MYYQQNSNQFLIGLVVGIALTLGVLWFLNRQPQQQPPPAFFQPNSTNFAR